jgi:NADH-quinone oxidoreductase subunit H
MFFLAEYINVITVSALCTTMFLGGWRPPPGFSHFHALSTGWFPMVWFLLKVVGFLFVFIWLRGTLPRLRYDQFMKLGWKVLIPVSLVWILVVASIRTLYNEVSDTRTRVTYLGIGFAVLMLVFTLWPQREKQEPAQVADEVIPVEQGGFPVPPLDLVVPPTPRSLQQVPNAPVGHQEDPS